MRRSTFAAQVALLESRFPWPREADEAREAYRAELWAKAEPWREDMARAFCAAVSRIVASKTFGRPTAQQVVNAAFEAGREGGQEALRAASAKADAARAEADLSAWRESCESRRADPEQRAVAARRVRSGARIWAPRSRQRRIALEWLRDFWGEPLSERDFALLLDAPRAAVARSRDRGATEPMGPFREPGEEG